LLEVQKGINLMWHTGLLLLVAMTGFASAVCGQSHRDFSGTWIMDPDHSESTHQEPPVASSTLVIRVTDPELTMETTRKEAGNAVAFHENLNFRLDGQETAGTGDGGTRVTGKARWDGANLVVETVREIHGATVTTLYIHTLSADGRTMTVDKTLTVQHGYQGRTGTNSGHGKDVFVRQSK
jgi:hypothetical protein